MASETKNVHFTRSTADINVKFYELYSQKSMVDVILSTSDGELLHTHKVILACSSSWFKDLFEVLPKDKQPVIVLKDVSISILNSIIDFIYLGTTNILENDVTTFKSALDALQISLEEFDDSGELEVDDEADLSSEVQMDETLSDKMEEEQFEAVQDVTNVKEEPLWDDLDAVIKEEKPKVAVKSPIKLPSSIQLKPSPKISNVTSMAATSSNPLIRIRTPASINEKVQQQDIESPRKTLKFVPKLPAVVTVPAVQQPVPEKQNIQELSKRLSKAILIRRVKKSDGSFVSERSPIKIIQGMKISKLPKKPLPNTTIQVTSTLEKRVLPVFRCSHCSKAFSVNKRRNAHEKFCFKNPSRPPSQCPYCPMVLCNPAYILTHIKKVHGIDEKGSWSVNDKD